MEPTKAYKEELTKISIPVISETATPETTTRNLGMNSDVSGTLTIVSAPSVESCDDSSSDDKTVKTRTKSEDKPRKSQYLAEGHSPFKTSIFVGGLYYNMDRLEDVPKSELTPQIEDAAIHRSILKFYNGK